MNDKIIQYLGGNDEREAFLNWIEIRTFNILRLRRQWIFIDAIAQKLLMKNKLTVILRTWIDFGYRCSF